MADERPASIPTSAIASIPRSDPLADPPDLNPAAAYLAGLGAGSQRTMQTALSTIAGLLGVGVVRDSADRDVRYLAIDWGALRVEQTQGIRAELAARYAPATANKLLAALRRVLAEARRLGQMGENDYAQAVAIAGLPVAPPRAPRVVTDAEVAALMAACAADSSPAGARDGAILALLREAGQRRGAVVALDRADYDAPSGVLTIRGKKTDRAVGTNEIGARLATWVTLRGDAPGPLFYGVTKGGRLVPRRLAGQAVAIICAARAAEAQVAAFTPEDLRRMNLRH